MDRPPFSLRLFRVDHHYCTTRIKAAKARGTVREWLRPNGKAQPPLRAAENCQNAPDLVRAAVGCSEGWAAWLE